VNEQPNSGEKEMNQSNSEIKNRKRETILVVDDEESVLKLVVKTLQRHEYRVLSAASGLEAIRTVEKYKGPIDLALIDLMMPELSGRVTYREIAKLRPGLKVIYMSGYSQLIAASEKLAQPGDEFLYKPYTLAGLVSRVQQVLKTAIDI
jgi:two-component system, cell cycle sensor histidine kinase and response regulator CckA